MNFFVLHGNGRALLLAAITLTAIWAQTAQVYAQPKPKAAVYIMGNPEGRDALRSAVNTFLVKSGKYQMIAVDAIDVVAQEQRRQMSGSVSDGDIAALGRDAGAQYVCVVQRSELDGVSYVATRMVSVQSKVAEAADIVELPPGGKIIDLIQWQIGSMLGMPVGPRPTAPAGSGYSARPAQPTYAATGQTNAAPAARTEPPIQGTAVPGESLAQKLAWLQKSADSHETYIIDVIADEAIVPNNTFEYSGAINITIVMRGVGGNRTLRLSAHGRMFTVKKEVTLVLENNITLKGHEGNNGRIIAVIGGKFKMNAGTSIIDNSGGGVTVSDGGIFEMRGGTISNNERKDIGGGGVRLDGGASNAEMGTFTMTGGTISGNTASVGGGIYVGNGTFNMIGGTVSGNTASKGGGVYLGYDGFWGTSSAKKTLNMRGGTISGNIATKYGGGVYAAQYGKLFKTGGIITGYKNDPTNGNVVKDEDGNVLARKGHAIYRSDNQRKETTAGPGVNFEYKNYDISGPWDQ